MPINPVVIESFSGSYRFLSNFYPSFVTYEGLTYPSVEHAFQAAKTHDQAIREEFSRLDKSPGQAKMDGGRLRLRPDWEQVKLKVMEELLRLKFAPGTHLAEKLLSTGNSVLIEGNTWNDQFWGVANGSGLNHLGLLLMEIRTSLHGLAQQKPCSQFSKKENFPQ